jgi:hypothetical protein
MSERRKYRHHFLPGWNALLQRVEEFPRGSAERRPVKNETDGVDQGQATAQATRIIGRRDSHRKEYIGDIFRGLEDFVHRNGISSLHSQFLDKPAEGGVGIQGGS